MLEIFVFFLIGVLTTLSVIVIINQYKKFTSNRIPKTYQSKVFLEIKSLMPGMFDRMFEIDSQSKVYEDTKTFIYLEKSGYIYWLDKNHIYYTEIKSDGRFDPDSKKIKSLKNLSAKEVTEMLAIYNSLKNG
jgi:hypothetical protein